MNEHLGRASYVLSKGETIMILNILQTANTVTVNLRGYMVIFFLLFLVYTKVKGETIRRTKVLKYIAAFLAIMFSYNLVFMFFTRAFTLGKFFTMCGYIILVVFWVGITKFINISIGFLEYCQGKKKDDDDVIDVKYKEL
jgi:hypothetical protein